MNFKGPFISSNFSEFWSRWHITLSTWLKDYLYISLGGNRKGFHRSNLNMLITMGLGGLWHGADIAYFFWGSFLGSMLAIERILDKYQLKIPDLKIIKIIQWILFLFLLAISGIFFRSGMFGDQSLNEISKLFSGLFSFREGKLLYRYQECIAYIILGLLLNYIEYKELFISGYEKIKPILLPAYSLLILFLLGLYGDGGGDFIYFQF